MTRNRDEFKYFLSDYKRSQMSLNTSLNRKVLKLESVNGSTNGGKEKR